MKQEISIFTIAACMAVFYFFSKPVYKLVLFFFSPLFSPLNTLPGPPSKHWYYGWTTKEENARIGDAIGKKHKEYGKVFYGLASYRTPTLYIIDEEAVNFIFQNQYILSPKHKSEHFRKTPIALRAAEAVLGSTVLATQRDVHKRQRNALQPAFNDQSIRQSSPLMYEIADKLIEALKVDIHRQGKEFGQIEILQYMKETALDMIGQIAFGEDFASLQKQNSTLFNSLYYLSTIVPTPTIYFFLRFRFPFIAQFTKHFVKQEKKFKENKDGVDKRAHELISKAEKEIEEQSESELRNILQIIKRSPASRMAISDDELKEILPALIFAGYETTSASISWVFHLLTRCQDGLDRQEILRSELKDGNNQAWRTDFGVLNRLPYLEAICTETLRLIPTTTKLDRECIQDTKIPLAVPITLRDGITKTNEISIKRGETVSVFVEGVNRLESLWGKDAERFLPERWLKVGHPLFDPELCQMTEQARTLGGWNHIMTFGQGVRMCLGFRFAVAEMKIVLAHCIDQFEWKAATDPSTGRPIVIEARRGSFVKPAIKASKQGQYALPISVIPL